MNQPGPSPSMRLKDKVILVTGSTTGIGEAMVRLFAREGAHVMIHGRRKDAAQKLAAEIGDRASFVLGALEDPEIPAKLVAETVARFSRIDGLVNNAAVITHGGIDDARHRGLRPHAGYQPEGAAFSHPGSSTVFS